MLNSGALAAGQPPAMIVPGQFSVGPSGAASYTIPIAVPPGTAGMVPALSLDYSSSSGDSVVGWDWNLSGLSSVGHCPRTLSQDSVHGGVNYDSNDRFCLGGRRLVSVSGTYGADGTVYRTEIDSFSKIVSYGSAGNGPAYFKVWTKTGLIMEFGNTTDSKLLAVGKTTARSWAVNKITDTKGNYLTVTYQNDTNNGQAYPTRIDYTGNAGVALYNSVQFAYNTARPDVTPTYQAGSLQQTTVLLTDIKTYQGSNLVYDYKLTYRLGSSTTHSRLTQLTLCDVNNACLAPTTFNWQGGTGTVSLTATANGTSQGATFVAGEFNGDGLTDFITQNTTNCGVYFGTQSGFSSSPMTAYYDQWSYDGELHVYYHAAYNGTACFDAKSTVTDAPTTRMGRFADFDGDGLTDIFVTQKVAASTKETFPLHNVGGSALNQVNYPSGYIIQPPVFDVGDFDGDGRTDVVTSSAIAGYQVLLSAGDGTFGYGGLSSSLQPTLADFNGDGCTDMLVQQTITYSCSPAASQSSIPNWSGSSIILGDFNGDGKTDFLVIGTSGATLYLSTGTGISAGYSISGSGDWYKYAVYVGDWNNDGKTDIALIASGVSGGYGVGTSHKILISTGTGFSQVATIDNSNSADTTVTAVVADWNNDGASDLWLQKPSGDTIYAGSYTPELMVSVSNGIGATTAITYDRLNKNGSLYTK
jgi:hypothetical protein